jgi:hypothetical protein
MICALSIVLGCKEPSDSAKTAQASNACRDSGPIALSATVVQPTAMQEQFAARRADRRWETTAAMPDALIEPTESFVRYLLNDVGDEFGAPVADALASGTAPNPTADVHPSLNLKDLHYVWKQFNDGCGRLKRIASLEYKTSYAGDFVEARCVGERNTRLIRLTFDKDDGHVNGCWLTNLPTAPTYPPVVYARSNAQCGRGMFEFLNRLCSLTLDVEVIERGDSPRRLDCSFDIWLRAHPFYFGAVSGQPHLQDRAGSIWRRVNPDIHFVKVNHDLNRYRIQGLQPGTYRVAARVRGCPGSLISSELFLDGSQHETEVVIALQWANSVEVVIQDSRNNEPLDGDLQLFLGGWRWRAWRVHPWERTVSSWGVNRYEADRLRYQDGRFTLGKLPAGEYVLGFNPPAECGMFTASEPPKEIVLTVQAGKHNKFVFTSDDVRKFINWNFDMCVDYANHEDLRIGYSFEDLIQPSTVALLGFSDRPDAQDVLGQLMRISTPAPLRLTAARALVRHDDLQSHILPRAAELLALVNANEQPVEFAAPCVEMLRRATRGVTETSAREMPDDIRRLVIDLGSDFPALRVYAAHQLASKGKRAAPAIPFLRAALADDRLEWTPDDEMLIDFERVSDAARQALSAITE